MIDQLFSMMKYCNELVFSGRNSFKFVQSLLENHVENIRKVWGSDRAKVYQVRMEQLLSYLVDLLSLESAKLVDTTQLVLDDIHA